MMPPPVAAKVRPLAVAYLTASANLDFETAATLRAELEEHGGEAIRAVGTIALATMNTLADVYGVPVDALLERVGLAAIDEAS